MPTTAELLTSRLSAAVSVLGVEADPELRTATRPEFGHFQSNLPLRLARPLGLPPREVGVRLLAALDVADVCLPPQLAGAGFVNLTLRPEFLAAAVPREARHPRLGVRTPVSRQLAVVDHPSPRWVAGRSRPRRRRARLPGRTPAVRHRTGVRRPGEAARRAVAGG